MTNKSEHPHVVIARALVESLVAGDVEGVGAIYSDDVVVFRNYDARELSRRQVMKVVAFLASSVANLRYENLRIEQTPSGFVQQHVLRGTALNGAELAAYGCLVATIKDERITRIDEYIDTAQMAPLMGG